MNDYDRLLGRISATDLAASKGAMEADRARSIFPSIADTIGDYIRLIQEEEKAQREQLLRSAIPKTAVEYLKDQFGIVSSSETIADALKFYDRADLNRTFGSSVYEMQLSGQIGQIAETLQLQNETFRKAIFGTNTFEDAKALATSSERYFLGDYLDNLRTSAGPLTDKMLHLGSLDSIRSPERLKAFVHASTVADILSNSFGFDEQVHQAWKSLTNQITPNFDSIQEYGKVLSAAGLTMPRWPHPRLLTIGEKRRRQHQRVQGRADIKFAKKAWPVIHRLEVSLRDVISTRMEQHYGEDWQRRRLPQCGCKDLLGKWQKRGGEVLDHADYAHYIWIMCNPEHFELIFSYGFDDSNAIEELLTKAKDLRIPVMHCLEFTQENLRDIRVTWRALEAGLLRLTSDVDFGYH
jgi:hypothetical protein